MESLPEPRRRGRPRKLATPMDGDVTNVPYDLIDDLPVSSKEVITAGRQVQRVQFHTGVHVAFQPRLSLDADKDNVTMSLCEHGLYILLSDGSEYVVGLPDILWMKLK